MKSATHIADLSMIASALRADIAKLHGEMEALAALEAPTPAQQATLERTAGAWMALRGVLGEHIDPMIAGWFEGVPQSRAAEIIVNNETPEGRFADVYQTVINGRAVAVTIPESENDDGPSVDQLKDGLRRCAKWSRDHAEPLRPSDDQDCCPACVAEGALAESTFEPLFRAEQQRLDAMAEGLDDEPWDDPAGDHDG